MKSKSDVSGEKPETSGPAVPSLPEVRERLAALLRDSAGAGTKLLDRVLTDPTAALWIPTVPGPMFYRLVSEIGRADCVELLELAKPEQVRDLLDLDLWTDGALDLHEALDWIHLLSSLPRSLAMRHLATLDVELWGRLILGLARVYLVEDGLAPEEPEGRYWSSPDGWFLLDIQGSNEQEADRLVAILDMLYEEQPEDTRRLLQNLLWELPTELEEFCRRWRDGRLQDLGFADPAEAMEIYAYLSPSQVSAAEDSADRPLRADSEPLGPMLLSLGIPRSGSFLDQVLALIEDPEEQVRLSLALFTLANRQLSADRVRPGDEEAARISLEDLHWRLSLGLEHLCDGEVGRGPGLLARVAVLRMARVGHSLGLDLRRRLLPADRAGLLGSRPGLGDRLDPPLRQTIEALLRPRPRFFEADTGRTRALRTRSDLASSHRSVDLALLAARIGQQANLPSRWPTGTTLGDLFRTWLVNRLLGREGPLSREDLARFIETQVQTLGDGTRVLAPAVRDRALSVFPTEARDLCIAWVERLEQCVAPLLPEGLDLRFVEGLWFERDP